MHMSLATTMPIMLVQTVSMLLLMLIGAVLYKGGFISSDGSKSIANIAIYVASPAVVLNSLACAFDPAKALEAGAVGLLTILFTGICIAVGRLVYRNENRIAQLGIMVSNMGFIGIPLVQTVIGEEYVFYISAAIAAQIFMTWTYGVYLVTQDKSVISLKKIFTNPCVIAVLVGVVLFFASVELTGVFASIATSLGGLNTGLAMMVLGVYLAQADLRALVRTPSLYKASFIRLVLTCGIILAILIPIPLARCVKLVLLIGFSAPCGTVTAIFPQLFGGDYRYGAALATASTLMSIVTMPLMLMMGLMVL